MCHRLAEYVYNMLTLTQLAPIFLKVPKGNKLYVYFVGGNESELEKTALARIINPIL